MNSDTIIVFILHVYVDRIASVNPNDWPWKAFIHSQHAFCAAQPCEIGLLQLQDIKKRGNVQCE